MYLQTKLKSRNKTAANGRRFGASGAVARPKVCADLKVLRPSEWQWKPRLPPSRWDVARKRGRTVQRDKVLKQIKVKKIFYDN